MIKQKCPVCDDYIIAYTDNIIAECSYCGTEYLIINRNNTPELIEKLGESSARNNQNIN